ncbi:MAG: hypothetical protein BGN98_10485 [Microbacterium sp. 69-7]|uniref:DUF5343 domain-containing protein n=1 Tax=Microbacterium sp. 69-7 TaxID=1895784 RepID=UPI000963BC7E|nr:DUF5343 domain-containing protein [Microbacterium sp. 69-7]OJU43632.1 MAG: hypothetical protein BGN98_10485 [Microbacterium sp. 69-7]
MSLPTAYLTSAKNTGDILQAMQSAQAPDRFTQKFLEGLGFPSSNDRTLINVMKALGFIDENGVPRKRYHEYLDQTRSAEVLATGIREAYADLFKINRNAQSMSTSDVKNKMKTLSEGQFSDRVVSLMASTFTTLVKFADFNAAPAEPAPSFDPEQGAGAEINASPQPDTHHPRENRRGSSLGLVYNINIHLPESRDPAVYDALFRALKEHLG